MSNPTTVQTTGSGALVTSLTSATYTVPAGSNKRLLVAFHGWLVTSATATQTLTITHNGSPMTQVARSVSNNANGGGASASILWLFDLLIPGSTTPSGTIVATLSGSMRTLMVAMTVADVDPAATPTLTLAQSIGPDSVTSALTDTVIDFVANDSQNTATGYALTVGAGQTQLSNSRVFALNANEGNLASSYENTVTTPTSSMSWTGNQSLGPRSQHVVVAYAAAASGNAGSGAVIEDADTSTGTGGPLVQASGTSTEDNDQSTGAGGPLIVAAGAVTEVNDTSTGSAGPVGGPNVASGAVTEDADTATGNAGPTAPIVIIDTHDGGSRKRQRKWDAEKRGREDLREQLRRLLNPPVEPEPAPVAAPVKPITPATETRITAPLMRPVRLPVLAAPDDDDEDDIEMLLLEMA